MAGKRHAVSVVIPTYNRVEDLGEALDSILVQTELPKEVVIVDNSEGCETEDLVNRTRRRFLDKRIAITYLRNRVISTNVSRNMGVANATGDLVLFMDDDVILDRQCLEEILRVYEMNPRAIGVAAYVENLPVHARLGNVACMLFFLFHLEPNRCRVLPSGQSVYPYPLDKVIECEWLSGGCSTYRRQIFEEFKFDEKLLRYSWMDDLDFSFRTFKKHRGSLFMTPRARCIHKGAGRKSKRKLPISVYTYITTTYWAYLFHKNIEQTWLNKAIFAWCNLGRLGFILWRKLVEKREESFICGIRSYGYTLRHLGDIRTGYFSFLYPDDSLTIQS